MFDRRLIDGGLVFDGCQIDIRYLFDSCSIGVPSDFDTCSINVRQVFDRFPIDSRGASPCTWLLFAQLCSCSGIKYEYQVAVPQAV